MLQVLEELADHAEKMFDKWKRGVNAERSDFDALLTKIESAIGIHRGNMLTVTGTAGSLDTSEAEAAPVADAAPSSTEPAAPAA